MPSDTEPPRIRAPEPFDLGPAASGTENILDGRYRLETVAGRGGTATVYRATDELLGRTVAVKVFASHLTDPVMVARQRLEMRLVAGLHHPHLVAVYDARMADELTEPSESAGPSYLVLEFMGGPSLSARLRHDSIAPTEVASIGAAIASALAVVHSAGLVHRDVKPGNILLSADGEPKLSDFGIARVLRAEPITHSADVLGTAPYLSPEQASGGKIGPATDIYALGLVLLECLTGHREFSGPAVEAAVARLFRDPVIPQTLPAPWPELLRAMTSTRPESRPTAQDVAATLATDRAINLDAETQVHHQEFVASIAVATETDQVELTLAGVPGKHSPKLRRTLLLAAGLILAVGIAISLSMFIIGNQSNPTTPVPAADTPSATNAPTPGVTVTASQPVLITVTTSAPPAQSPTGQPSQTDKGESEPAEAPQSTTQDEVEPPNTAGEADNGSPGGGNGNGNNGNGNGNNGNGNGNNGNGNGANNGNGGNGNGNGGNNGNGS